MQGGACMCVEPHEEGDREYPVLMPEEYHVLQPALVFSAVPEVTRAFCFANNLLAK